MEKIKILDFRFNIEKETKSKIDNIDLISKLLYEKGLVFKQFGLCAEPFDKYYEISHTDKRGVSCVKNPLNTVRAIVNCDTSTRKKTIYFYSITINFIEGFYYLCCLAQSSFYKNSTGAKHIVYKATEDEISKVLDEIFKNVDKENLCHSEK